MRCPAEIHPSVAIGFDERVPSPRVLLDLREPEFGAVFQCEQKFVVTLIYQFFNPVEVGEIILQQMFEQAGRQCHDRVFVSGHCQCGHRDSKRLLISLFRVD
jgi:hypothetical protein